MTDGGDIMYVPLNIKTDNISLYETAFTHTSYANECQTESYERLEYLGDSILEFISSKYLFKKYKMLVFGKNIAYTHKCSIFICT